MGITILFLAPLMDTSAQSGEVEVRNGPSANSLLKPPSSDGSPVKVAVALVLLSITDIDEVGPRFHVNAFCLHEMAGLATEIRRDLHKQAREHDDNTP
jgi:hypothetical protein